MSNANGSRPASPLRLNECIECASTGGITINECDNYHAGLTKREHFAALAMQAISSNHMLTDTLHNNRAYSECAGMAVEMADALLTELGK